MDIPRFNPESINPRFASGDIGEAFQSFVYELLVRECPNLHSFPAGGKDGAIDLVDSSNGNLVIECKFVGEDEYPSIEARWKSVRKLLEKHLADPIGPTAGQSQYSPWYSALNPIGEYWFCVSALLKNDSQRRALRDSISDFFNELVKQYPHLSHLRGIDVEVLDWSDLTRKLQKQPQLVFRWFPSSRPRGLVPLDEAADVGTFRSYLTSAKLPYYSIAEHLGLTPPPAGITVPDEETLLTTLEESQNTGLIISGKGGIGKSRLTLELGWLALSKGWSVMRVQSRLTEGALEWFAERLTPDAKALLLIDYIETQSDFGELVETINVLNDSHVASIQYVAACRTNFYYRTIVNSERHLPVNLTPLPGSPTVDWFTDYRHKTVERILAKSGLPTTEKYLQLCNNVPILAIFLAYLYTSGRSDDLADLLDEVEFGRWVAKRVQLTFPDRNVSRELALLTPLFPMAEGVVSQLSGSVYQQIFQRLAADGWLENVPSVEATATWVTAHDVLADQILLAYAKSVPNTAETLVSDLLSLAVETGCLSSAIVSLQRVFDIPPLSAVRWLKVISDAISGNESDWFEVRGMLIRTTLLSASEQLVLLRSHEGLWDGIEQDSGFQKALGWLTRRVVKQEPVSEEDRRTLSEWIVRTIPTAQRSNFVITWGLRFMPDAVKDAALAWIVDKPFLWQTHYLMVSWLDCGLEPQAIAVYVQQWCRRFSRNFHLSFLVSSWLNAGGDHASVQSAIGDWLLEHRRSAQAGFVYSSWLNAGGDEALVQDAITDWLIEHRRSAETRFVYKAWLDVGGDKGLVRDAIADWLIEHRRGAEAGFVYRSWLNADGDEALVRDAIADWLIEHRRNKEAGFVYNAWLDIGGDKALVRKAIAEWLIDHRSTTGASHVYKAWLDAGGSKDTVRDALRDWLSLHAEDADADHVFRSWLEVGGERDLVWEAAIAWLAKHKTEESAVYVTKFIAKQKDLPIETVKDILTWCRCFPQNQDALWRLTQLREQLSIPEVAEEVVASAEIALEYLLDQRAYIKGQTKESIITLFFDLIAANEMRSGPLRVRVDKLLEKWIRDPRSFGPYTTRFRLLQNPRFLHRLSALLEDRILDPASDLEPLRRFMQWLNTWEPERKQALAPFLSELKGRYPIPQLWDLVQIDQGR